MKSTRVRTRPPNTEPRLRADREASKSQGPDSLAYWEAIVAPSLLEVAAASGRLTSRRLSSCM